MLLRHSLYRGVNVSILQNYTYFEDHITKPEPEKNTFSKKYIFSLSYKPVHLFQK